MCLFSLGVSIGLKCTAEERQIFFVLGMQRSICGNGVCERREGRVTDVNESAYLCSHIPVDL